MGQHYIKAVIFDIDGTLVDSFETYYKVFNKGVAGFHEAPISRYVLRDYLAKGLSLREILQRVFLSACRVSTVSGRDLRFLVADYLGVNHCCFHQVPGFCTTGG